ncbi:carbohydrate esterase family 4 protein [Plicaturopsis crispa FD-325 SS-3]|nr:carbohydrate esterase family 4 protein [Plicaturopsis crispa FD-325 SS-3]
MKFSTSVILSVAAIPVVAAHDNAARHHKVARQAAAAAPSSGSASATTPAPSASSAAATGLPVTLLSTNPSAVPIASIVAGAASQATVPLASTATPGATPTWASNAPALPAASSLVIANYPPLDKPPPTDSPEVQQWIQDVKNSGVNIPNINATVDGGCPANLAAVADDANRCWWTCGGCTRSTDITTCPDKMTWGLTYDDGPSLYTPDLLNYLDSQSLKATFFVVGSRALSNPGILQAQYMGGHQIGVHTWSHPSLTTLSNEEIIAELGWTKKIIKDVLGVTPNTMRPPFGDIDDRVRAISTAMGLTPIIWTRISPMATFDTEDFEISGGTVTVQQVMQNWESILGNASTINNGFIVLEHDLFQQTVDVATGYILPDALAHKNPSFKIEPVVSCLNKPLTDAYIELNDNKTNPPAASGSAVTLTSGAPGSAQATGGSSASSSGAAGRFSADGLTAFTLATGLIAGALSLLA